MKNKGQYPAWQRRHEAVLELRLKRTVAHMFR